MQVAKRGDIGVVIGRDCDAVANGEAVKLATGTPVPCRLVRLAQARQVEAKGPALFIEDAASADP